MEGSYRLSSTIYFPSYQRTGLQFLKTWCTTQFVKSTLIFIKNVTPTVRQAIIYVNLYLHTVGYIIQSDIFNENIRQLTASELTSLPPFSLNSKRVTGALCGPLTEAKSLSIPFQILSSPFSHPVAKIFLSGCHARAVTWETAWLG